MHAVSSSLRHILIFIIGNENCPTNCFCYLFNLCALPDSFVTTMLSVSMWMKTMLLLPMRNKTSKIRWHFGNQILKTAASAAFFMLLWSKIGWQKCSKIGRLLTNGLPFSHGTGDSLSGTSYVRLRCSFCEMDFISSLWSSHVTAVTTQKESRHTTTEQAAHCT